jgi:hypothetical protein
MNIPKRNTNGRPRRLWALLLENQTTLGSLPKAVGLVYGIGENTK